MFLVLTFEMLVEKDRKRLNCKLPGLSNTTEVTGVSDISNITEITPLLIWLILLKLFY